MICETVCAKHTKYKFKYIFFYFAFDDYLFCFRLHGIILRFGYKSFDTVFKEFVEFFFGILNNIKTFLMSMNILGMKISFLNMFP